MKAFLGITEVATPETFLKTICGCKKVQEHHAIIQPKRYQRKRFAQLSPTRAKRFYLQVMRTTLAMFAENYRYEETVILTGVWNNYV